MSNPVVIPVANPEPNALPTILAAVVPIAPDRPPAIKGPNALPKAIETPTLTKSPIPISPASYVLVYLPLGLKR